MIFGVKGAFSCGCWYLQGGTSGIAIDINCLFALNLLTGPVELLQVNSIEIEQRTMRARKLRRVLTYLIFVTGATGGARVNLFCPVKFFTDLTRKIGNLLCKLAIYCVNWQVTV